MPAEIKLNDRQQRQADELAAGYRKLDAARLWHRAVSADLPVERAAVRIEWTRRHGNLIGLPGQLWPDSPPAPQYPDRSTEEER